MSTELATAIISSSTAVLVAALSYVFVKKREREAEWRRLKLEHYREYLHALDGISIATPSVEAHDRYARAVNTVVLVASQGVIHALQVFRVETAWDNKQRTPQEHDRKLSELLYQIRRDLDIRPRDKRASFKFTLIARPPRGAAA